MNSQLVPGGHCSLTYVSPVILTFSHKHVLYRENFFLLHLFLFHWSYEWYKIEWVISAHTLHSFTIFSFFTLCNLSTASVLPLKPSLSYRICFVNSSLIWCCFPPLLSCNSLLILLLPFLCLSPCVPSLPSPCNFLTIINPSVISPTLRSSQSPCRELAKKPISPSYPILSHKPWPTENCYFDGHKFSSNECFRTHYLQHLHQAIVFYYFVNCICTSPLSRAETLETSLTQASQQTSPLSVCFLYQLYITKFCEFFYILLNSHT